MRYIIHMQELLTRPGISHTVLLTSFRRNGHRVGTPVGMMSAGLNGGMLLLHQYPLLIASAVVTGAGFALLMPTLGTAYLSATTDRNRSQTMGLRGSAISLAILLAPLTQAAVAHWITPQITFTISIAIALVVILVAYFGLRGIAPLPTT